MFTRKIKFALAGVGGAAALAIGAAAPASAATGPAVYTTNSAGYVVTGANFEAVTTTVGARPVSQYNATANKTGFGHGICLTSKQYQACLGISVFHGDSGPAPWDAAFDLTNGNSSTQLASCLAGNNGGTTDTCNASVTGEPGAFTPGSVKLTISYNPATNQLNFDAVQGTNDFAGGINLGTRFGTPTTYFKTAQVGTTLTVPFTQPAQPQLLGKFSATSVTTYSGTTSGLGAHTTHQQFATSDGTSSGTVLLSPTALSNHGHVFQVFDDQG